MKINTEDLHLSYGAQEILKGISIQSKEKEFIGLIGRTEAENQRFSSAFTGL